MRRGISSYAFAWNIGVDGSMPQNPLSAFGLIDIAASHQLDCIQIADNMPLHLFSPGNLNDLFEYSVKKGILLEVGAKGLTEANLAKYIEIASFLKTDLLRFVIDNSNYKPDIDTIVSILKNFANVLEHSKISLAIENHDRLMAHEFESIICKTGSDNIGICLDTVNSMGAGEGIETVVEILAPYTFNFHIKEFEIRRVWHMMGFLIEGKPLGEGMLPIEKILGKLTSKCKSAILEQWVPPEKDIRDTVEKEMDWGIKSIDKLKELVK